MLKNLVVDRAKSDCVTATKVLIEKNSIQFCSLTFFTQENVKWNIFSMMRIWEQSVSELSLRLEVFENFRTFHGWPFSWFEWAMEWYGRYSCTWMMIINAYNAYMPSGLAPPPLLLSEKPHHGKYCATHNTMSPIVHERTSTLSRNISMPGDMLNTTRLRSS